MDGKIKEEDTQLGRVQWVFGRQQQSGSVAVMHRALLLWHKNADGKA